jgi:hypothetical protein
VELPPFRGNASTATTAATASTAAATAAASTTTAAASISLESPSSDTPDTISSSPQQMHLELGGYVGECIGMGTPRGGGLLMFCKVSCIMPYSCVAYCVSVTEHASYCL